MLLLCVSCQICIVVCSSLRFRIPLKVRASRTSIPYSLSLIYFFILYIDTRHAQSAKECNILSAFTFSYLLYPWSYIKLACTLHSVLRDQKAKPSVFQFNLNCNNQLDRLNLFSRKFDIHKEIDHHLLEERS